MRMWNSDIRLETEARNEKDGWSMRRTLGLIFVAVVVAALSAAGVVVYAQQTQPMPLQPAAPAPPPGSLPSLLSRSRTNSVRREAQTTARCCGSSSAAAGGTATDGVRRSGAAGQHRDSAPICSGRSVAELR